MAIHVRQASLDDGRILTGLIQRYLKRDTDERRFHWLYRENPFGVARAWIACEEDAMVGMAALFPRRIYCDGALALGCVLGDFCIGTAHRSLGPALLLQRACLKGARSGEFALAYDFPSTTMLGIYQHLGLRPVAKSVRMVKILRLDDKIARLLPVRVLSRPATLAANFALSFSTRKSSDVPGLDFGLQEGPCTDEYSVLAARIGSSLGVCTVRDAEYLNWRYRRHPNVKYEFLTARRGTELLAYCVFTTQNGDAMVADLFGSIDDRVIRSMLQWLIALVRARGAATLSVPLLDSDVRAPLLRKLGFWAREGAPVMVFGPRASVCGTPMFLMHGDRES